MLVGHQKKRAELQAQIKSGSFAHAHLFIGPKHIGKTKLAQELSIELQGASEDPILKKQILEGAHPDSLFLLDEGEILTIKEVRELVQRVGQSHHSPHLVVVIENIGRMKLESMNALLKTLEEPPEGTVFFLTAHCDDDVLDTIRSRTQVHYLTTVSNGEMEVLCDGHAFTSQLLNYAMGRPGKLKRLLADEDYFQEHQSMHERLVQFLEKPTIHRALSLSRDFEKSPEVDELLDLLLHQVRTLALKGETPPVLSHLDLTETMDTIEASKADLNGNVNKKLRLDTLLLPFAP